MRTRMCSGPKFARKGSVRCKHSSELSLMRIVVTGGLGAVGSFLVPELERRGHSVFVVDLRHHHNAPNYARCDVSEFRQVERLWSGGGWPNGYTPAGRSF